jgi:membrane protease YdiL (CAAX protease family)
VNAPSRHRSIVAALVILGLHNLVQNSVLNEKGYVTGNLAVSSALVAIGRHSGATWADMGLGPSRASRSLKMGATVGVMAGAAAAIAMAHPRTRDLLGAARHHPDGSNEVVRRVLVRFTIGTALFEEIAFRGVVPSLMGGDSRRGDAISAGLFAVWHLIPAARIQRETARSQDWSPRRRAGTTLLASGAAGIAGLGFSLLRRRSGNLFAPWLVHAMVNSVAFMARIRRREAPPLRLSMV